MLLNNIYVLERTNIRKMYTKLTALVLVAAIAAVLVTSATIAMTDDADAKRKSQSSVQINKCGFAACQSVSSQIQGSGNKVFIFQGQFD